MEGREEVRAKGDWLRFGADKTPVSRGEGN